MNPYPFKWSYHLTVPFIFLSPPQTMMSGMSKRVKNKKSQKFEKKRNYETVIFILFYYYIQRTNLNSYGIQIFCLKSI
jgi:hypothetical protein